MVLRGTVLGEEVPMPGSGRSDIPRNNHIIRESYISTSVVACCAEVFKHSFPCRPGFQLVYGFTLPLMLS
jgi:hypothetical protein